MRTTTILIAAITFLIANFNFSKLCAQHVGEGSFMIGGGISFESTVNDFGDNQSKLQITPLFGFYPIDNLGIGASFLLVYEDNFNTTRTQRGFGPFIRYYMTEGLFPQVQYVTISEERLNSTARGSGFIFSLGYTLFLNSSIGLEPSIFYSTVGSNSYGFQLGFQGFLGR